MVHFMRFVKPGIGFCRIPACIVSRSSNKGITGKQVRLTAAALYSHGRDGSHKPVLLSRCFEEEDSGFTGGGFPFRGRGIITGGKL